MTQIRELQKLKRAFELLDLKIATGVTLESALRAQAEAPRVSKQVAKQWDRLRDAIDHGRIPPRAGVRAFANLIEVQLFCATESHRRGFNAKIQSRVLGALSLTMIPLVSFLVRSPIVSLINLISVLLCVAGFCVLTLIAGRIQKQLWRLEWLMFWFYVGSLIEWGMTPAQALSQGLTTCELSARLPLRLREHLSTVATSLRQAEIPAPFPFPQSPKLDAMDFEIMNHFSRATTQGLQLSILIKNYTDIYQKWLQARLQAKAESSAYLNLIPLYFCFAPAIFLVLVGSLVMSLATGS